MVRNRSSLVFTWRWSEWCGVDWRVCVWGGGGQENGGALCKVFSGMKEATVSLCPAQDQSKITCVRMITVVVAFLNGLYLHRGLISTSRHSLWKGDSWLSQWCFYGIQVFTQWHRPVSHVFISLSHQCQTWQRDYPVGITAIRLHSSLYQVICLSCISFLSPIMAKIRLSLDMIDTNLFICLNYSLASESQNTPSYDMAGLKQVFCILLPTYITGFV